MGRLTKYRGDSADIEKIKSFQVCAEACKYYDCYDCPIQEAITKLAHYEDLEEQGRLIELPCAVGDTVWIKGIPVEISFIHIDNEVTYCIQFDCSCCADDCPFYEDEVSWEGEHDCKSLGYMEFKNEDIGKTVFRTKEEAEAKLKELEGDKE